MKTGSLENDFIRNGSRRENNENLGTSITYSSSFRIFAFIMRLVSPIAILHEMHKARASDEKSNKFPCIKMIRVRYMSAAERRFVTEVSSLVDKTVTVNTVNNKTYTGILAGIDPENLSLCLADAKDEKGQVIRRVILSGNAVYQVISTEKAFDLKGLSERLEKVFPRMVRLYEKEGFIWVMDKIKVTENGIAEGTGPAAERVQRVYSQFMSETKQL